AALRTACLGLVVALNAGCGGGGTESVETFNGVTITVRLPRGQHMKVSGRTGDEVHTWKSGDLEYAIDHMRLKVNGQDHGLVKAGDNVLIEQGRVFVNGEERTPGPEPEEPAKAD